ncbi:MAG: AAA family ATPase [Pseudomonadota bacterium]
MELLEPPESDTELLLHPKTRADVDGLLARSACEGGFLLTGPKGQGKATLAYALAEALLAGHEQIGQSAEKVRALIKAGAHPDLLTLRRGVNEKTGKLRQEIDVDAVRAVIGRLQQTSTTGRRVVIVDLADDLGRAAANSLLKVLEEPPHGTCLLLLSLAPSRLLPTIVSRCRRIVVRAPEEGSLVPWLIRHGEVSESQAQDIARESRCAPGSSLRLAAGEWQDATALADALLDAATTGTDLLKASRGFGGKGAELVAEDAAGLIIRRLAQRAMDHAGTDEGRSALDAHDAAKAVFDQAGTADPAQTAYIAGLAIRKAQSGAAA